MYQQQHSGDGGGQGSPPARPATGPGNTAVATYLDPASGEETNVFRVSSPGAPPVEYQLLAELRRLGVPGEDVRHLHTDLRPGMLPGGYTLAFVSRAFPRAELSCSQEYGATPQERAEGIAALVRQVEMVHRIGGRQAPPTPFRPPLPTDVAPAPVPDDEELGARLDQLFGAQGVQRLDPAASAAAPLPAAARATLTRAGLPADVPYFFTADRPEAPPPGGYLTDAAGHLRAVGTGTDEGTLGVLAGHVRIGTDGAWAITVQCDEPAHMPTRAGQVWSVDPRTGHGLRVNASVSALARSLALLVRTRQQLAGQDPYAAGATLADFQQQLAAVDPTALDDPTTWWSLVLEQLWHGLF